MYPYNPESARVCQSLISAKECDIGNAECDEAPMNFNDLRPSIAPALVLYASEAVLPALPQPEWFPCPMPG
jgi:hypothetical protein